MSTPPHQSPDPYGGLAPSTGSGLAGLDRRVRAAVVQVIQMRAPLLEAAQPPLALADIYRAACRFVLRWVVIQCAGAKTLLPSPDSTHPLRGSVPPQHGDSAAPSLDASATWAGLLHRVHQLHPDPAIASPHGSVDPFDAESSLFAPGTPTGTDMQRALAILESPHPAPASLSVRRFISTLANAATPTDSGASTTARPGPMDFTQLDGPGLGALYEGLLDYELRRVGTDPVVVLNVAGTPAVSIVQLEQMNDATVRALVRTARPPAHFDHMATPTDPSPAWTRACAWADRAIQHTRADGAHDPSHQNSGRSLIQRIETTGAYYLERWGGTRKGAGTFYTVAGLTEPTVERTLHPLLRAPDGALRTPEDILALKVCDPAMGAGSFLLAALERFTDAVVESLHTHERVHRVDEALVVSCAGLSAKGHGTVRFHSPDELRRAIRQRVATGCIFGVDLDPLAVALARAALWVALQSPDVPPVTLHAGLRCGNAVIGAAHALTRHYPLQALQRQSPDRTHDGVHHTRNTWHTQLLARRRTIRRTWSDTPSPAVESPQPANASPATLRTAFDTWCALWFWPLDRLEALPTPAELAAPSPAARQIVRALARTHRFFHWELAFPDVVGPAHPGFDAILGNPPWETQKPNSKEFFSNHDPLYRTYLRQEALARQKVLFTKDPNLETDWLRYKGSFNDHSNFVRHRTSPAGAAHPPSTVQTGPAQPFRHQGSADRNAYKLFIEQSHALLRPGGQLGMVVPSSIYTDNGARDLRALLLDQCRWRWLYGFENRHKLFDIHRSFKFCILIAEKGGQTDHIQTAFMRHALDDWQELRGVSRYAASAVRAFSPASLSLLELSSHRDLEVLQTLYKNGVRMGQQGPEGWGLRYARELDTTNDSHRFVARDAAEQLGYQPDVYGRWNHPDGTTLTPLYEGRMVGSLNFSAKGWVDGRGRRAVWRPVPWTHHRIEPQFLLRAPDARSTRIHPGPKVAYMRIGSSTNARTVISTYLRDVPATDSVFYFLPCREPIRTALALTGVFSTFAYDWAVRLRLGGLNLSEFLMVETPLPRIVPPELHRLVLSLACGAPQFAREWMAHAAPVSTPWRRLWAVTPHERLRLRCMVDAIVAVLYGLQRDDLAWILKDCDHPSPRLSESKFTRQLDPKGFWRIDRHQPPELRQTVLTLAAFDALTVCIGQSKGDRAQGIRAFCTQNNGEGWMVPIQLSLTDLALTRTVSSTPKTARFGHPSPVRSQLGPRFFAWQLAQSAPESWAECAHHAAVLRQQYEHAKSPT